MPALPAADQSGGRGHSALVALPCVASLPDDIAALNMLQRRLNAVTRAMTRLQNQRCAFARSVLGWSYALPEKERERINKVAAALVNAIQDGESAPEAAEADYAAVAPFVRASALASVNFQTLRDETEGAMIEIAERLPALDFVKGVRGFGLLSFAKLIGECGDLSGYAGPAKVWKRMGLAPKPCYLMTCKDGSEAAAIPRRRRSVMWVIGDVLIKMNKDGPYRTLYDQRKALERERHPEMSKMHTHRRAQRVAEKRLLVDLWVAWRACGG